MTGLLIPIILMAIALFILSICAIYFVKKQLDKKNQETLFVANRKGVQTRFLHAAYVFFNTFPLTQGFIKKIRKRYEIIEPGDTVKTERDTIKTALKIFGISFVAFIAGALIEPSLYTIVVCGILSYVISSSILFNSIRKKERKLIVQLDQFVTDTSHEYYGTNMVETAIDNVCMDAEEPILTHMTKINETLSSGEDEDIVNYIDNTPNRFLQLFLSACMFVNVYDDQLVRGFSLFISNLNSIKTEIGLWLRTQKMLLEKFRFRTFMIILPMCIVRPVDQYMIKNFDITRPYYEGPYGIILSVVICITCVFLYSMTEKMKDIDYKDENEHLILHFISNLKFVKAVQDSYEDRKYGKVTKMNQLLRQMGANMNMRYLQLERFLSMIGMFILAVAIAFSSVHVSKQLYINKTSDLESSLSYLVTNDEKREELIEYSSDLTYSYKEQGEVPSMDNIIATIDSDVTINKSVIELMAQSVYERLSAYFSIYFKWWYLLICAAIGALGYQLPYLLIITRKDMMLMAQENEVIQFQSIISMLMHIKQVTVEDILQWMCRFSIIFKDSLQNCINDLASGETNALESLKENEPYLPFQKIVDNLIDADSVGIENAFVEVDGDRTASQKKREQDNELYITHKSNLATVLAFIPILLLIIGYICGPILFASNSSLSSLSASLN